MDIPNNETNATSVQIIEIVDNNNDNVPPTCIIKTIIICCALYVLPIIQLIIPNISFSHCLCDSFLTMSIWAITDGVLSIVYLTMYFFTMMHKCYNVIRWIICFLKLIWFVVGIALISNLCVDIYCQNDTGFFIICIIYDFIFLITIMLATLYDL